jgi:hypothetical protein
MKRMAFNRFSYRLVFKPDRERDGKGVSEETTGGWVVRISFHFVPYSLVMQMLPNEMERRLNSCKFQAPLLQFRFHVADDI